MHKFKAFIEHYPAYAIGDNVNQSKLWFSVSPMSDPQFWMTSISVVEVRHVGITFVLHKNKIKIGSSTFISIKIRLKDIHHEIGKWHQTVGRHPTTFQHIYIVQLMVFLVLMSQQSMDIRFRHAPMHCSVQVSQNRLKNGYIKCLTLSNISGISLENLLRKNKILQSIMQDGSFCSVIDLFCTF